LELKNNVLFSRRRNVGVQGEFNRLAGVIESQ